jgi:predicted phage terminase large subunit-like protein
MNDFQIYTFVDPAISQKQSADYTAIVTIWINSIWQIYVLELTRARLLPTEIINKIFEHVKTYNPVAVWVETVQYQKMLAIEVKNEMIKRNSFFTLEEIKPMWEKNARIKTILEPIIEKRNLFLINQKHIEIENELYWFPAGKHDDAIDALSWAITMWNWKMNRGIAKVYDEWELTGGLYY